MGFFGITDFTTIAAEGLDVIGNDVEGNFAKAINEATSSLKVFKNKKDI